MSHHWHKIMLNQQPGINHLWCHIDFFHVSRLSSVKTCPSKDLVSLIDSPLMSLPDCKARGYWKNRVSMVIKWITLLKSMPRHWHKIMLNQQPGINHLWCHIDFFHVSRLSSVKACLSKDLVSLIDSPLMNLPDCKARWLRGPWPCWQWFFW